MADYDNIAPFYDTVHGSRKQTIAYVRELLLQYHPEAKSLLALACGTGAVVKGLSKFYSVEGLDISPGMIKEAKKKLPKSQFHVANMCDFKLAQQYDVVTCLYASLNHVLGFDQWCEMFQTALAHLKPGGVLVFDVMSETGLYNMVLNSPLIIKRFGHISMGEIQMSETGDHSIWRARGFSRFRRKDAPPVYDVTVKQVAYPFELIREALLAIFPEVYVDDPEQDGANEGSEIFYFICRK